MLELCYKTTLMSGYLTYVCISTIDADMVQMYRTLDICMKHNPVYLLYIYRISTESVCKVLAV